MTSGVGGHEGREPEGGSSELADQLRRIVLDLSAGQQEGEQQETPALEPQNDEVRTQSADTMAVVEALKRDLEEASAESMVSIRLLHELIQLRHTELLNHLVRIEQNLQDGINLMERRVRGDFSSLRLELGITAATEDEE